MAIPPWIWKEGECSEVPLIKSGPLKCAWPATPVFRPLWEVIMYASFWGAKGGGGESISWGGGGQVKGRSREKERSRRGRLRWREEKVSLRRRGEGGCVERAGGSGGGLQMEMRSGKWCEKSVLSNHTAVNLPLWWSAVLPHSSSRVAGSYHC